MPEDLNSTATTTTPTTTGDPWYKGVAGVDSEIVGHWTNAGWHTKTAAEIALEATKSWKNAEKFVGAPATELVRLPKDAADEAGWKNVWTRLGKPAEAKDYDFTAIKGADGQPRNDDFINFMREQAFTLNLPKDTAAALATRLAKFNDDKSTSAATESAAKLIEEKTELTKNWGPNFEANKFVAGRAAAALGVDPATVAALEGVIGYAKIMEMFRTIGTKIGEDKFVTGTQGGDKSGIMTRDQATARLSELKADKEYVKSYMAGDATKKREMEALHRIILGTQQAA